ncbi:MAG: Jag N-terminal domain-containing protein [Helicobacteraceae bacterium]|jgi:spoIIIJ-associated protein|nr:Jag N-terminal domain-containing protein [Helicobacteraceae bacterium]
MKRIEAPTLQEAYTLAAMEFGCSVTELEFDVAQQPSPGVFGLFRKTAIVYAAKKERHAPAAPIVAERQNVKVEKVEQTPIEKPTEAPPRAPAPIQAPKAPAAPSVERKVVKPDRYEKPAYKPSVTDSIIDDAFSDDVAPSVKEIKQERPKPIARPSKLFIDRNESFGSLDSSLEKIRQKSQDHKVICKEIENVLRALFAHTCYKIDVIEASMIDSNTVRVFFDGEDAALLIGKDGYRYKALSYILFNWINPTYGYLLRLEIAEFLQNQEEMITRYLEPVIAQIEESGKGQTRILDGVLVQIALKELRSRFPEKYVGIKTSQDGEGKYVVVNDFIRRYER